MQHKDERDLRDALRAEAGRHHPDSAAIWDRIDQGRIGARSHRMVRFADLFPRLGDGMLRPAATAAAVAAVLIAGVTGTRLANRSPEPGRQAAGQQLPATPSPGGSTTPSAPRPIGGPPAATQRPTAPTPSRSASPTPSESSAHSARPSPAAPGGNDSDVPIRDDYLSATAVRNSHSISSWTQDDLTLGTTETITALDVTIKVAVTPGVADTGHWTSIPVQMVTTSMTMQGEALVYRFTLKPGATLAPGNYTFAAQFNHSTDARPATVDTYTAKTTAGRGADIAGHFTK
ncbi:MAG TPA: hypothetical protein VGB74_17700 [Actinoplanes sp.]